MNILQKVLIKFDLLPLIVDILNLKCVEEDPTRLIKSALKIRNGLQYKT